VIPTLLLRVSVVLGVIGLAMGIAMGIKQDFTLAPAHAHLNLLGLVLLFMMGLYCHAFPQAAATTLAKVQAAIATIGSALFPTGIAAGLIGDHDRLVRVIVIDALIVFTGRHAAVHLDRVPHASAQAPSDRVRGRLRRDMRKQIQVAAWLVLLTASTKCFGEAAASCRQIDGKPMLQADLFFGRDIAGRYHVSDAQWSDFLRRQVTPHFPEGLTVLAAFGQWHDPKTGRITREPSFFVRIAVADTPETLSKLMEIRNTYMRRFHQESVGLTLTTTCALF
jgi:Protein of unknown function (DUF3574)